MRALSRLCSRLYQVITIFFSATLPEAINLMILTTCVLWVSYKRARSSYKYIKMLNKRSFKFVHRKKLRPELHECAICLSEVLEGEEGRELLGCKHDFHRKCIERWLEYNHATCPLCRELVMPMKIVAENYRLRNEVHVCDTEKQLALVLLSAFHGGSCPHVFFSSKRYCLHW